MEQRPELDRWIISELNTLTKNVDDSYADYEPTKAGRLIQNFVDEHLSNWFVRLSRRRFWKGEYSSDKISAYQTLYTCLDVIARLSSPIAPFFMDELFRDLNYVTGKYAANSVHLVDFPVYNAQFIDKDLEERMELAQAVSSMVLSLRKRTNIRVRQPLNKIMVPVLNDTFRRQLELIKSLILAEVNVKELEFLSEGNSILVKKIKPNFKTLGPRVGKLMKDIANAILQFSQEDINSLESKGVFPIAISGETIEIQLSDVEIFTEDIPGWVVANSGTLTVALDITITTELEEEGIARELINRIQNLRKEKNFEVTDRIVVEIEKIPEIIHAVEHNYSYICSETLADSLVLTEQIINDDKTAIDIVNDLKTNIFVGRK